MAVPSYQRKRNPLEVITLLEDFTVYWYKITANKNNFKKGTDFELLLQMRDLLRLANEYVNAANSIFFNKQYIEKYEMRSRYQDTAKIYIIRFNSDARIVKKVYHVDDKKYNYWQSKIDSIMEKLVKWIQSDAKNYSEGLKKKNSK